MNQNKKNSVPAKKGGIAEEIERLKQRRDDRKNKGEKGDGRSDPDYETLIRKKKLQFNKEPDNVILNLKYINVHNYSIHLQKEQKSLCL